MEIFRIFVSVVLGLYQNIVAEREHVIVGDIQYECGPDGQIIRTKSNTTKLRLPINCKAMYSVNTERTTDCTNQQRCTLMTWKIVRELEMFLNTNHNNSGPQGIVEFKNEMIIPDFNYLLHVTLKNSRDQIQEKDFNITFNDDRSNESKKVLGNLDLKIGSSYVYSTLPVIVNANVTLCGNVSFYFFRWLVITSGREEILPVKSSKLTFSPQILKNNDEKFCIISCLVIDVKNNSTLLEGSAKIIFKDLPKGLQNKIDVILPFKYTTINKGSPISIIPYIHTTLDSDAEYKIEWSCMFEKKWLYGCQGQINKEFYIETGFDQEGNYSITLKVRREKLENSATCYILIGIDVPSIELDTELPIRPDRGIKITAKIYELRTYCSVHWDSEEGNYLELNDIPGFHKDIYNISSKDKTFLAEIEEYGNITTIKEFKLNIPPPSRKWEGLHAGNYNIKLIVSCPTMTEINDMNEIREAPEHFITISAQTEFYVPPVPRVRSLEVFSDKHNIALKSNYFYKIVKADDVNDPMIYKYGFILKNIEVVFYSGIDIFDAETIMAYNGENGIETFIEACDYQNRCGKTIGPVIKTSHPDDLDDNLISKTFKQLLIEEDYYKAFSYAFIVVHSVSPSDQFKNYNTMFSSEIFQKIKYLMEENYENKKPVINDLLKNLLIFVNYLALSEEVMEQLSLMSKEFSTNIISHLRVPRHVSRNLLSITENKVATLEEIQNYLIASEYVILNSINTEPNNKQKDHMINLLDGWMVLACDMLFNGLRVEKLEMKTMVLGIEKISKKLVDKFIQIPFSNNIWNVTAKLKIKDMSDYSTKDLCLGQTMLRNYFNKVGVTFGANIYSADEELMQVNVSAQIRIFIPIDKVISEIIRQPKCTVYTNGFNLACSVVKQFTDFTEYLCPAFGYYFTEYTDVLTDIEGRNVGIFQNISYDSFNRTDDNKTEDNVYGNVQLGQKISYVIIISSLVGILILCYIIRKLTILPQQHIGLDGLPDNVLYGHVMHEELLE